MEVQARFHPSILNSKRVTTLRRVIFWQRPLVPPEVGPCTFEPTEKRLTKGLPSVEARTIYEMLNQLRYGDGLLIKTALTRDQRDRIASALLQGRTITFDKLRSLLKLPEEILFSPVAGHKKDLQDFASKSAAAMRQRFGKCWLGMQLRDKDEIIKRLIEEEDEGALTIWLQSAYGLKADSAKSVAAWSPPEVTSRLGQTANEAVLAELIDGMSDDGCLLTYDEAVKSAGEKLGRNWPHPDFRCDEVQLPLPYYGKVLQRHVAFACRDFKNSEEKRFGKLTNPTIHVVLNQLRRIVNRLVSCYGEPSQIVLELARELKLSKKQKDEERKRRAKDRKADDLRGIELEKLGQANAADNHLRLRLFEEQQLANGGVALCPYSLRPISIATLFSSEVEIDHILPYSKTFDDTFSNCVICYRAASLRKHNRSPFEAFGHAERWSDIVEHAANLPTRKYWRFAPDAMERYDWKTRNFLAGQINDTHYFSRIVRFYLAAACGLDNVYVTTSQLTAMLRARWGLNSFLQRYDCVDLAGPKRRNDHRHQTVDACVIGAMDRGLQQRTTRRAQVELDGVPCIREEPFPDFQKAVHEKLNQLTVSIKADHGKEGALHEDTAYGIISNEAEALEIGNLVLRKALVDLAVNEIDRVRDPALRTALQELAAPFRDKAGKLTNEKGLRSALAAFSEEKRPGRMQGVRRVRIGKRKSGVRLIRNRQTGVAYKAVSPGENHHIDIVQMRDGTWRGFAATVFDVNQKGWRPIWERERLGGKLVMRIHKGDMIEVDDRDGLRRVKIVHSISPSNNTLHLAAHNEGGELKKRHVDKNDLFRWDFASISSLKNRNARRVIVNEIGRVRDKRSNILAST